MTTVLIAVYSAAQFTELFRLGLLLRRSDFEPVFVFYWRGATADRCASELRHDGLSCIDRNGEALRPSSAVRQEVTRGAPEERPALRSGVVRVIKAALPPLRFCLGVVRYFARELKELRLARALIARQRPAVVILAEDNVGENTAALIRAGHDAAAPAVILPYTVTSGREAAEAIIRIPAYSLSNWANRLVARFYPRWVFEHRGEKLVRLPAAQVMAKEWLGLSPPSPWTSNSGAADAICVESEYMQSHYERQGLPLEKLIFTGALYDDVLAEELSEAPRRRTELCRELGLPDSRLLVVCAGYEELVAFWLRTLRTLSNCNVIVRLHPRAGDDEMEYVEQFGLPISRRDTATLVPLCDIYVASVSATIRWAIMCGKPVVNYDVYRLRYSDYVTAKGVSTVEEQEAFEELLDRLTTEPAYYDEVAGLQRSCMREWGQLDGKAADRILGLIDNLIIGAGKRRGHELVHGPSRARKHIAGLSRRHVKGCRT
jgi:hypothetical protein